MHMQSLSTLNPNLLRGFQPRRRWSLFRAVWEFWMDLFDPQRRSGLMG